MGINMVTNWYIVDDSYTALFCSFNETVELRNYYSSICSRMLNKDVQVHSLHLQEIEL